jgi:diguanylate cyclase (GGDEF)-like protein/PAS domain S-box-containing protein
MMTLDDMDLINARKPSVLIVDDEDSNIHILAESLRSDYEIYICKESQNVLNLACEILPNIVLLDVMMPVLDGYEVCRQLKDNAVTKDIPVIFVTALLDEESEAYGFELGAVDYIHKPFKVSVVKARVRTHITIQGMLEKLITSNTVLNEKLQELNYTQVSFDNEIDRAHSIKKRQEIYAKVFNTTAEGVIVTDSKIRILAVNKSFSRITGYSESEVLETTTNLYADEETQDQFYNTVLEKLNHSNFWNGETNFRTKSGEVFPVLQTISKVLNEDKQVTNYITVFSDIKHLKKSQEKINFLTWYDTLTKLPNRHLFLDRLSQAISLSARDSSFSAVIVINLDDFKKVNSAHGLLIGDEVLIAVSNVIKQQLHDEDTISRLSSDEFAILIHSQNTSLTTASENALKISEKIKCVLHESISTSKGSLIRLTASIGISVFPHTENDSAHEILQHAVIARHKSQSNGKNQSMFFVEAMGQQALKRFEFEQELTYAIENNELEVYLQSKIGPDSDIVGAEALVRWIHPSKGMIPPDEFIPIAEQSNLIIDIDRWVLKEAAKVIKQLHSQSKNMTISVNISPKHFESFTFVNEIESLISSYELAPELLYLEVTEGVMINDIEKVIAQMKEIHKLGVQFSADDFGTGFCSLAYLKRLPIQEIKIDKSFILEAPFDQSNSLFIDMIYSIAGHMQIKIVAEGVESIKHVEFLKKYPNMIHQGYYYCKPIPSFLWLQNILK